MKKYLLPLLLICATASAEVPAPAAPPAPTPAKPVVPQAPPAPTVADLQKQIEALKAENTNLQQMLTIMRQQRDSYSQVANDLQAQAQMAQTPKAPAK